MKIAARIYSPAKTATQSGTANTNKWILEFCDYERKEVDKIMGWIGSKNMMSSELRMEFDSLEKAEQYAKSLDIDYVVSKPKSKKVIIKQYISNFTN